MYIMGIDLGSSAVKIAVANENGEIITRTSEKIPTIATQPTYREQNAELIYKKTISAMKKAVNQLSRKAQVVSIGISGQMMGMVCLDINTKPIADFYTWEDQRSYMYCSSNTQAVDITKNIITPAHWLPKLIWMRHNSPDEFSRIDKIVFLKDYIRYRFTGNIGLECSELLGSYLYDVDNNMFSENLCAKAGVTTQNMPSKIYSSFESAGYLKRSIAEEIGIDTLIPTLIIAGGADIAMSALAHGAIDNNTIGISIGTSGAVYCSCDILTKRNDENLYTMFHALSGKYLNYGITISAGASLIWANDTFYPGNNITDTLNSIQRVSNHERPIFLPYLNGERSPINDIYAKGVFLGITHNTTKNDFILSIMEGVSFSLKDISTYFPQKRFGKVVLSGGGSDNQLWCQIIADVMNAEVFSLNQTDASAIGAIIAAAYGAGIYSSLEGAIEAISTLKIRAKPVNEYVNEYSHLFNVYNDIYLRLKELFPQLVSTQMETK